MVSFTKTLFYIRGILIWLRVQQIMNWIIFITTFLFIYFGCVDCWLNVMKTYSFQTAKENSTKSDENQTSGNCRKDRHCAENQFCHRYDKNCANCRTENQKCRRNKMCCRGMECANGACRKKIQLGELGSLCSKDRDCNYGFCCARQNGQSVCKPMLQEDDVCGVPTDGSEYLWNHQCPCAHGLKCKRSEKLKDFQSIMQDWEREPHNRCVLQQIT